MYIPGPDQVAVENIKSKNPKCSVLLYSSMITNVIQIADDEIYPGWYMTLAGTNLSHSIGSTDTQLTVGNVQILSSNFPNNPDILVDLESMTINSIDLESFTINVTRGVFSNATSHTAGARIAQHALGGGWVLNPTTYCPQSYSNQTWNSFISLMTASYYNSFVEYPLGYDGVVVDYSDFEIFWSDNGQWDANNDNIPDKGEGPSNLGWFEGVTNLSNTIREYFPTAIIIGSDYHDSWDGITFTSFPNDFSNYPSALSAYLSLSSPNGKQNYTIVQVQTQNTSDWNAMRFGLGISLLADGYFSFDIGKLVPFVITSFLLFRISRSFVVVR